MQEGVRNSKTQTAINKPVIYLIAFNFNIVTFYDGRSCSGQLCNNGIEGIIFCVATKKRVFFSKIKVNDEYEIAFRQFDIHHSLQTRHAMSRALLVARVSFQRSYGCAFTEPKSTPISSE